MRVFAVAFSATVCFLSTAAFATPVLYLNGGNYAFSGVSADVTSAPYSSPCINFFNTVESTCGTAASILAASSTGPQFQVDPSLFTGGVTATILGIPGSSGNMVSDFITAPGTVPVMFDLDSLVIPPLTTACTTALTAVVSCELPNSPFIFEINAPNNVTVTFSANLCAYTVSDTTGCTPYSGTFTSQFNGTFNGGTPVTLQNLLTSIESSAGISNTVSATLSPSSVPEPGTSLLLGAGLISIGLLSRRRKRS